MLTYSRLKAKLGIWMLQTLEIALLIFGRSWMKSTFSLMQQFKLAHQLWRLINIERRLFGRELLGSFRAKSQHTCRLLQLAKDRIE